MHIYKIILFILTILTTSSHNEDVGFLITLIKILKFDANTELSKHDPSFELIDQETFHWENVYNNYFGVKNPEKDKIDIFKTKIYSPLFKIINIVSIICKNLNFFDKCISLHDIKNFKHYDMITSILTEEGKAEFKFSKLLEFLDLYFKDDYEKSELTNSYFLNFFTRFVSILSNIFALHCTEKNIEKINCVFFQNLVCVQYKYINIDDSKILCEYGSDKIFDFHDKILTINKNVSLPLNMRVPKNIKCEIIYYPEYIFIDSMYDTKTIFKMFFELVNPESPTDFKPLKISFYDKTYQICGFLEFDSKNNNFCYVNLSTLPNKSKYYEYSNFSLVYLGIIRRKNYFLKSKIENVIVILEKVD